jgi:branched-chain amino acid transport system substrate-binding protein
VGMAEPVNIGFLAPLTGQVRSWGAPGLNGCELWSDWINNVGGVLMSGRRYPVKLIPYDCGYDPARAMAGARELVENHNVKLLMTLGGDTLSLARDYLTDRKILTTTLLPSDLSPDTPYLIAPSEVHPVYVVTGVEYLARVHPDAERVALCSQTDAMGLPSLATYRAAFKATGRQIVHEVRYDSGGADAETVVAAMLAEAPDVLCWCTSYTPMVHALTEAAYRAGFQGQIISCTVDDYAGLIDKTSAAFMEGVIFQFPDFDDPALREKAFFFNQPKRFYDSYQERFPNSWSAVSWEYAAILDIWHAAVEKAGDASPVSVLAAMKQMGEVNHAFGPADWWGEDVFGISNALIGDWPVVTIQNGKARIVEFGSVRDWLGAHGEALKAEMAALGQLWRQRFESRGGAPELGARGVE